jgi:hypothetical protein
MSQRVITRRQVTALAKSYGTTAVYHPDREALEHEITIDAPDGTVWSCSQIHQIVACGADGTPWETLYADVFERMSYGLETCEEPDCDVCRDAIQEREKGDDDGVEYADPRDERDRS